MPRYVDRWRFRYQKLFLEQTNRFYSWHFGESLYFLIHPIICLTGIRLRRIKSPYGVTPEIIRAKFSPEDRKRKDHSQIFK